MSGLGRLLFLLMLLVCSAPLAVPAAETLSVNIADSDPGLTGRLGKQEPLYLRISYNSDRPVRVRAEGFAGARKIDAMNNGMPLHVAGQGEALVWIAYDKGTILDRLRISLHDDKWREVHAVSVPVQLQWDAGARRDTHQRAAWVARMVEAQQRMISQQMNDATPAGGMWLGATLMAAMPAYFVLQVWFAWGWTGGWRTAALLPLTAVVPAIVYSLFALAHGSNLWPLAVIFLAPLGFIYLVVVWAARRLTDPAPA